MDIKGMKAVVLFLLLTGFCAGVYSELPASKPTHYFYTPTPYVNDEMGLVASLHEVSFTFPGKLEAMLSLLDNVGRINLGAKYGFSNKASVGAGLAWTLARVGPGDHGDHGVPEYAEPRFGIFGCFGTQSDMFEWNVTPHAQLGNHFSVGADAGIMVTPHEWWSIIWEIGTSVDLTDGILYLNTDGGVRVHPPAIPFMNFDIGVDLCEFPVVEDTSPAVNVYFDVIFTTKF